MTSLEHTASNKDFFFYNFFLTDQVTLFVYFSPSEQLNLLDLFIVSLKQGAAKRRAPRRDL